MSPFETETIEINLLLEAIYQRYGHDFRSYARASIERRIRHFLPCSGCRTITEMIDRVLRDEVFFSRLAHYFSITVTEMFRDPSVYCAMRKKVIPMLKTWPHFKVWHAGCATGEEAYSLAIVLAESGLYNRATIYATDFNDTSLEQAREGVYEIETIKTATQNYQQSGGQASFSEYYHAQYNKAVMNSTLKERITFANHNLALDQSFGEMHLVFCRNVLIYFNIDLQNRALELITDSLVHGGFLCLGAREGIQFTSVQDLYDVVDEKERIYKKKSREKFSMTLPLQDVNSVPGLSRTGFVVVVIGCSAGGFHALVEILSRLPADFSFPVLVVQHLHSSDNGLFARNLDLKIPQTATTPCDKERIRPDVVYVAPANYHILVERNGIIALTVDKKVNWSRPSIDVLFESAAYALGKGVIAVLLSGANHDGTVGMGIIKQAGGLTLAQNPDTAEIPVMPKSAIDAGVVDEVYDLPGIAERLRKLAKGSKLKIP